MVMRRSTVNRPRLARRMREKSAAAMPVISFAFLTESPRLSSTRMIRAARMERSLLKVGFWASEVTEDVPAAADQFNLLRHLSISFITEINSLGAKH